MNKEKDLPSILEELALEWDTMSQEQKDHLIELFTQEEINQSII